MRGAVIATAVLFINTSAYGAPVNLVCKGKVSTIRWDVKDAGRYVIEDSMESDQWTVTIDPATEKLTLYPVPGFAGEPGEFHGEGDIKHISMQASIDEEKGTPWEGVALPSDGIINRVTGAFVVAFPTQLKPKRGWEYSGTCKQARPLF